MRDKDSGRDLVHAIKIERHLCQSAGPEHGKPWINLGNYENGTCIMSRRKHVGERWIDRHEITQAKKDT